MWKHKTKYKGQVFQGKYERKKNGERIFNLTSPAREISFESWQKAIQANFVKLNAKKPQFWAR